MLTILGFISVLKLHYISVKLKSSYFIPDNRNKVCKYILDNEAWKALRSIKRKKQDFPLTF